MTASVFTSRKNQCLSRRVYFHVSCLFLYWAIAHHLNRTSIEGADSRLSEQKLGSLAAYSLPARDGVAGALPGPGRSRPVLFRPVRGWVGPRVGLSRAGLGPGLGHVGGQKGSFSSKHNNIWEKA